MLWELEDIKSLSTPETLPTVREIEENMAAWKSALDNSVKSRYMMNVSNFSRVDLFYNKRK